MVKMVVVAESAVTTSAINQYLGILIHASERTVRMVIPKFRAEVDNVTNCHAQVLR